MKSVLLLFFITAVFSNPLAENDGDHLEVLAKDIMKDLERSHMPSSDGHHNSPLNQLVTGRFGQHHLFEAPSRVDKITVRVGVVGMKFVSVNQNGRVVNITTSFGVGAGAMYKIIQKGNEEAFEEDFDEESSEQFDQMMDEMNRKYAEPAPPGNQTSVCLGQKAKFGLKMKQKGKEVKMKVLHGYVVHAKTNVTRAGVVKH